MTLSPLCGIRTIAGSLLATMLLFAISVPQAPAADEMRKEIAKIAKAVHDILEDRDQTTVSIGQFTGPSTFPATAGPGMTQMLTEEIQKLGMTVKTPADVGVEGRFLMQEIEEPDPNNSLVKQKRLSLRIKGSLVDKIGRQLTDFNLDTRITDGEFKVDVKKEEAVTAALGITGALPTDSTIEERSNLILEQLKNPVTHIEGTRVFAQAGSPYAVEIVSNGAPLAVTSPDKLALCDVPVQKSYAVRLYNLSEYECGVRLSIDGLSAFTFSTLRHTTGPRKGDPLYDHYIIPPKSFIEIRGWHKTNAAADSFLVTDLPNAAAAVLKLPAAKLPMGTVTAQFCAAWPADGFPPPDEPSAKKGEPRGTGIGPPTAQALTEVKRNIGVLRSTVCVRYAK